jgi:predicted enzyme related to lactoylglutathione lyase
MATAGATKVQGIHATYYTVKDLDRAVKFYTALLGAEPTEKNADVNAEWTFAGGETFGLYKPDASEWTPHAGIEFGVDDLKAAVEENKARGVKFDDNGKIEETPVCYMAFGQDTEGNSFILHQHK